LQIGHAPARPDDNGLPGELPLELWRPVGLAFEDTEDWELGIGHLLLVGCRRTQANSWDFLFNPGGVAEGSPGLSEATPRGMRHRSDVSTPVGSHILRPYCAVNRLTFSSTVHDFFADCNRRNSATKSF